MNFGFCFGFLFVPEIESGILLGLGLVLETAELYYFFRTALRLSLLNMADFRYSRGFYHYQSYGRFALTAGPVLFATYFFRRGD